MKLLEAIYDRFCDKITRAIKIIDYEHHEIHDGSSFMAFQLSAVNALDIASPLTFSFITPNSAKHIHITLEADLADAGYVEVFEDDGDPLSFDISGGAVFTPVNRNRYLRTASDALVRTAVTVTQATANARIYAKSMVAKWGGPITHKEEIILRPNWHYLFRLSTYADNNEGSLNLNWYEHTAKTSIYG